MGRFCLGGVSGDRSGCIGWDDRDVEAPETMTHVRSSSDHALIIADSQTDGLHAHARLTSIDDEGFTLDWVSDRAGREFAYVALTGQQTRSRGGLLHRIPRLLRTGRPG